MLPFTLRPRRLLSVTWNDAMMQWCNGAMMHTQCAGGAVLPGGDQTGPVLQWREPAAHRAGVLATLHRGRGQRRFRRGARLRRLVN